MLVRLVLVLPVLLATTAIAQTIRADVSKKLEQQVAALDFRELTLPEAVGLLQDKTRLNIVVRWAGLEGSGVDLKQPLGGRLYDVTAKAALNYLLDIGTDGRIKWSIDDNGLIVLNAPPLLVTRVYNVEKLIKAAGHMDGDEAVDSVITAITSTIDTEQWRESGGVIGSIGSIGTRVYITNTPEVHTKIVKFLRDLETADAK